MVFFFNNNGNTMIFVIKIKSREVQNVFYKVPDEMNLLCSVDHLIQSFIVYNILLLKSLLFQSQICTFWYEKYLFYNVFLLYVGISSHLYGFFVNFYLFWNSDSSNRIFL